MADATRQDYTLFEGDQLVIECSVEDSAGDPVDITSWTFVARIGSKATPDLVDATIAVVSAAGGTFTATFAAADMQDLTPNAGYTYNIKGDNGAGLVRILGWGLINVRDSLYVS
jgi:hypothetical protein